MPSKCQSLSGQWEQARPVGSRESRQEWRLGPVGQPFRLTLQWDLPLGTWSGERLGAYLSRQTSANWKGFKISRRKGFWQTEASLVLEEGQNPPNLKS